MEPGSGIVYTTDKAWFDHFRPTPRTTVVDEVNFWRPTAKLGFRALKPGEPLFFRLKKPYEVVAGFGFFAAHVQMTVQAQERH
jgi:putative restriction endonuclease